MKSPKLTIEIIKGSGTKQSHAPIKRGEPAQLAERQFIKSLSTVHVMVVHASVASSILKVE